MKTTFITFVLGSIFIVNSAIVQQSKVHFPGFGNVSSNHTGINIGGGAIFPLSDNMGVNAQLKYQSNIEQFAINGGFLFSF